MVVCAYNEEKHIERTISDLLKCPAAEEVIVVNDGSKDKTEKILKKFGNRIRLISYKKNRGKGYAMVKGINSAQGKVVVFLDAHLKNLENNHLQKLSQPILKREANYVLGSYGNYGWSVIHTGQRAYLREILLPHLDSLKKTRFGIETYLNDIFKVCWGGITMLEGLVHIIKHHKISRGEAINDYFQEILEILKAKIRLLIKKHQHLQKINFYNVKVNKIFNKH